MCRHFRNTSRFHIEAFLQPRQDILVRLLGTSELQVSSWLDTPTTVAKFVRIRTNWAMGDLTEDGER